MPQTKKNRKYRIFVPLPLKEALRGREGAYVDRPEAESRVPGYLWTPDRYSSQKAAYEAALSLTAWLHVSAGRRNPENEAKVYSLHVWSE